MQSDSVPLAGGSAGDLLFGVLVLAFLLHAVTKALPMFGPVVRGLFIAVGVIVFAIAAFILSLSAPAAFLGTWLAIGLPAWMYRRHRARATARETWKRRIDAALGHERRAAPLPTLPASTGGTQGSIGSASPSSGGSATSPTSALP